MIVFIGGGESGSFTSCFNGGTGDLTHDLVQARHALLPLSHALHGLWYEFLNSTKQPNQISSQMGYKKLNIMVIALLIITAVYERHPGLLIQSCLQITSPKKSYIHIY